jgi:hypothetical protein
MPKPSGGVALSRINRAYDRQQERLALARDKNDNLTPEADRKLQGQLRRDFYAREARRTA